jgi:hypothetical protein
VALLTDSEHKRGMDMVETRPVPEKAQKVDASPNNLPGFLQFCDPIDTVAMLVRC